MSKQSDLVNIAQGDTITVDHANGRVGIGTSSPSRTLTLSGGAGSVNLALQDANTGSSATDGFQLQLASNGDAYLWNYENAVQVFGTNNTERMRIDSAGRVTMPYQPSFWVQITSNYTQGVGSGLAIGTNNGWSILTRNNTGGHYNSATGVFTAPVSGVYVFGINDLYGAGSGYIQSGISVNGGVFNAFKYTDSSGTVYDSASTTITTNLTANDYITFYVNSNTSDSFLHGSGYNNMFGYLLG